MTMNKVTKTTDKKTEVATLDVSMFTPAAGEVTGFENINSADDVSIPFLRVLSQVSGQCNQASNNYMPGAEPGMIYQTIDKKLYDGQEGVDVIPCGYKREFVEWDANQQGKLIKVHSADIDLGQTSRDANYVLRMANGNTLKETTRHYVMILDKEEGVKKALITMAGTAIKQAKAWNSMMDGIRLQGKEGPITPSMFSHIYTLKTAPQSNAKGTWFGWDIYKKEIVKDAKIYAEAKAFAQAVGRDDVKVVDENEEQQAPVSSAYTA